MCSSILTLHFIYLSFCLSLYSSLIEKKNHLLSVPALNQIWERFTLDCRNRYCTITLLMNPPITNYTFPMTWHIMSLLFVSEDGVLALPRLHFLFSPSLVLMHTNKHTHVRSFIIICIVNFKLLQVLFIFGHSDSLALWSCFCWPTLCIYSLCSF